MSKSGWGNKGTNECLFLKGYGLSLGSLGAEHKTGILVQETYWENALRGRREREVAQDRGEQLSKSLVSPESGFSLLP